MDGLHRQLVQLSCLLSLTDHTLEAQRVAFGCGVLLSAGALRQLREPFEHSLLLGSVAAVGVGRNIPFGTLTAKGIRLLEHGLPELQHLLFLLVRYVDSLDGLGTYY